MTGNKSTAGDPELVAAEIVIVVDSPSGSMVPIGLVAPVGNVMALWPMDMTVSPLTIVVILANVDLEVS